MNIFALDRIPETAAKLHCDKHVLKMIVETYQMLGSALIRHGCTPDQMPKTKSGNPLKGGYHNHPCTRWVGNTYHNFQWATRLGRSLCDEYRLRYGKDHFCESGIKQMQYSATRSRIPWVGGRLDAFHQAMPDEYRKPDPIAGYRNYYRNHKAAAMQMSWTNRPVPEWMR